MNLSEYKFTRQVLEEQGFEAKVGNRIKLKLDDFVIEAEITKIDGDQVYAIGKEISNK
jgi:hypothetical protein